MRRHQIFDNLEEAVSEKKQDHILVRTEHQRVFVFRLFTIDDLIDYYKFHIQNNMSIIMHEIIPNNHGCCFFMDLDGKNSDNIEQYFVTNTSIIEDSSTTQKISRHIKDPAMWFPSAEHLKAYVDQILLTLDKNSISCVDRAVYGSNRSLRMYYSGKTGDVNRKMLERRGNENICVFDENFAKLAVLTIRQRNSTVPQYNLECTKKIDNILHPDGGSSGGGGGGGGGGGVSFRFKKISEVKAEIVNEMTSALQKLVSFYSKEPVSIKCTKIGVRIGAPQRMVIVDFTSRFCPVKYCVRKDNVPHRTGMERVCKIMRSKIILSCSFNVKCKGQALTCIGAKTRGLCNIIDTVYNEIS